MIQTELLPPLQSHFSTLVTCAEMAHVDGSPEFVYVVGTPIIGLLFLIFGKRKIQFLATRIDPNCDKRLSLQLYQLKRKIISKAFWLLSIPKTK